MKKYWTSNKKESNTANRLTTLLFAVYLIALFWILLFKLGVRFSYMESRRIRLIPFSDAFSSGGKMDLGEIVLNVLIFVPLGIYAGILFRRWTFAKKLLFFFLISLLVEVFQLILATGAFDITDIITNTLGGIIGLMMFKVIEKGFNNSFKAQKFINIIAATGTALMILFLVLLKMRMLPIRYQ